MMGTSTTTPSPSPAPAMKPLSVASAAGTKRKRNTPGKYYAVKKGYQPGVYFEWNDCLTQVTGYKGAVFQAFSTIEEANSFLRGTKAPLGGATHSDLVHTRFYGIQRGRVPGVYTDWAQAQEQIRGFQRPSYKKFSTRAEAEEFVKMGQQSGASFASDSTKTQKLSGAPGIMDGIPKDEHGVPYEAADGPLGLDAEDGFDPNVLLDPKTGKAVYKLPEQKTSTKFQAKGPPGMLRIYTDGSSLANGRAVASAGVGVYFGPGDSRNVSEPLKGNRQTNQRAELTAILRALDIAPRHRDVTIFTDSQYSIKCVTEWFRSWRRNNWMTSSNKPVENKDLVESILDKIEERDKLRVKTFFEWLKGHNNDPGNEAADRLAVNGAQKGVADKQAAMEAVRNIPDDAFDDDSE